VSLVNDAVDGRSVLVTGAAGSIGSALCSQLLRYCPSHLSCVDSSETGLFYLKRDLEKLAQASSCSFHLADVGDQESNHFLFKEFPPDIIFHAAAHKHIPLLESNVRQAVKNNVFGLLEVIRAAEASGASSLIMVSSDKAVNPISVVGATKRLGEIILATKPAARLRCVSARLGNVLGSSGSVIPIWTQQLRDGDPLTITHPDAERYFMQIGQATDLLLRAAALGQHGDILVFDMGEPIPILRLAKSLIAQSGKSEAQVSIRYVGLRDGEKVKERIFYDNEEPEATASPAIMRTRLACQLSGALSRQLDDLRNSIAQDPEADIKARLKDLVPEYCYQQCRIASVLNR
jgi:FlaA1/EpsC-like NDP-sugar epimerase